jgi:hypothetical protein
MLRTVTLIAKPDIDRQRIEIPDGVSRSGKGPIIVRPGDVLNVTLAERDYLLEHRASLFPQRLPFVADSRLVPLQIEIPADKQRSCEGALHLRPGCSLELTEDERDFLKKEHPQVFAQLRSTAAARRPSPVRPSERELRDTEPPSAP